MPTEHLKSKESYRKFRAYTHIHGIPTHAKDVVAAGKKHKVKHSKLKDRKQLGDIRRAKSKKEARKNTISRRARKRA